MRPGEGCEVGQEKDGADFPYGKARSGFQDDNG